MKQIFKGMNLPSKAVDDFFNLLSSDERYEGLKNIAIFLPIISKKSLLFALTIIVKAIKYGKKPIFISQATVRQVLDAFKYPLNTDTIESASVGVNVEKVDSAFVDVEEKASKALNSLLYEMYSIADSPLLVVVSPNLELETKIKKSVDENYRFAFRCKTLFTEFESRIFGDIEDPEKELGIREVNVMGEYSVITDGEIHTFNIASLLKLSRVLATDSSPIVVRGLDFDKYHNFLLCAILNKLKEEDGLFYQADSGKPPTLKKNDVVYIDIDAFQDNIASVEENLKYNYIKMFLFNFFLTKKWFRKKIKEEIEEALFLKDPAAIFLIKPYDRMFDGFAENMVKSCGFNIVNGMEENLIGAFILNGNPLKKMLEDDIIGIYYSGANYENRIEAVEKELLVRSDVCYKENGAEEKEVDGYGMLVLHYKNTKKIVDLVINPNKLVKTTVYSYPELELKRATVSLDKVILALPFVTDVLLFSARGKDGKSRRIALVNVSTEVPNQMSLGIRDIERILESKLQRINEHLPEFYKIYKIKVSVIPVKTLRKHLGSVDTLLVDL
jgi:hypothetical protein